MFEFDAGKLILVGIVALIVLGPKELPRVMLQAGQALAKMRRMAADFRAQFMEAMREAAAEDPNSEVAKLTKAVQSPADPIAQIKAELTNALGPPGNDAGVPLSEHLSADQTPRRGSQAALGPPEQRAPSDVPAAAEAACLPATPVADPAGPAAAGQADQRGDAAGGHKL